MTLFHFQIQKINLDGNDLISSDLTRLIVVTQGQGILKTTQMSLHLAAGNVLVINPNTTYYFSDTIDLNYYLLLFDAAQLQEMANDIFALSGYHALFMIEPLLLEHGELLEATRFPSPGDEAIVKLLNLIADEYEQQRPGYQTLVIAYFLQLITQLSRQYTPLESAEQIWRMGKVAAHVELHYQESIVLEELASIAGMSINHFMRMFKKFFDLPPIEYVIHQRVYKACNLMKTTDLHISQIADQVGFSDGNYFARQFRKVMGRSPREFRKDAQSATLPL